eukprot:11213047-Lingulodinium_polyedra.AAC.1
MAPPGAILAMVPATRVAQRPAEISAVLFVAGRSGSRCLLGKAPPPPAHAEVPLPAEVALAQQDKAPARVGRCAAAVD